MHQDDGGIDWDKFLVSIGLEPTRADRCTYVGYQGIESQKPKPYKAKLVQEEGSPFLRGIFYVL